MKQKGRNNWKISITVCSLMSVAGVGGILAATHPSRPGMGRHTMVANEGMLSANWPSHDMRAASLSIPQNTQGSENWAGYIDTPNSNATSYTSVAGSWVVPNVAGSANSGAAQWIGLGGSSNQDLLQIGTIEQLANGQSQAEVFWEKLPAVAQNVMTVPIGSKISVRVAQGNGSTWNLTVNVTTPSGQSKTKTIPVTLGSSYAAGIGTSAEWISEDPSDQNNQLYPLANAGTVNFTGAMVDGKALADSSNQVQPIAMADTAGNVLIAPSGVGSDGASFSTTTVSQTTQMPQRTQRRHFPFEGHQHDEWGWHPGGWQVVEIPQGYGYEYGYDSFPFGGYQVQFYWQ